VSNTQEHVTSDCDADLGRLESSISDSTRQDLLRWNAHDDEAALSYCDVGDSTDEEAEFVDLLVNPERFTGYRGPSAHRIWRSIYEENCFKPEQPVSNPFEALKNMCIEKRAFYRAVSGLHTSINLHLCAGFLMTEKAQSLAALSSDRVVWGPNLEEFRRRFDPELTEGYGPQRLKNLYFLYLLELRAFVKATPYLVKREFYTGIAEDDEATKYAIQEFLRVLGSFSELHFDETTMFSDPKEGKQLKEEFRQHFLNITRIMDCVGCDKCKLWGKLQIQGLGTALKILFTPEEYFRPRESGASVPAFRLRRNEIVALFNAFARLSTSMHHLNTFRTMLK
jgi:ERO1-like protein alpha